MGSTCTKNPIIIKKTNNHNNQLYSDLTNHETKSNFNSYPISENEIERIQFNNKSAEVQSHIIQKDLKNNLVNSPNIPQNLKSDEVVKSSTAPIKDNISNNFEFIKGQCIGQGNLGKVYSGLSKETGDIVAIKSLKLNKAHSLHDQIIKIQEAIEELTKLEHKNIIKYRGTQPSENSYEIEIISEFCNGGSINQILDRFGTFDEKLIRLYVKQILEGLVYLHEKNIIHRNIKTSNILVDSNGKIKLSDFVVSNILIGDDSEAILYFNTNNGQDAPFCMAPEIVNKEKNITSAVDIWSLGCIIIEMATKIPPWANITTDCNKVISLIGRSNAPPKFPSHVSKDLKSFLNCCLQKNPTKRLTAKQLLGHNLFYVNCSTKDLNKKQKNEDEDIFKKNSQSFEKKLDDMKLENNVISLAKHLNKDKNINHKFSSNKILQNVRLNIVEKQDEKTQTPENSAKVVNMFVKSNIEDNQFFSLSLTANSQLSILDKSRAFFDNRILPENIIEVEEFDSPIKKKKQADIEEMNMNEIDIETNIDENFNSGIQNENKITFPNIRNKQSYNQNPHPSNYFLGNTNINKNLIQKEPNKNSINESYLSLKYIIENQKLNDFVDLDNKDVLPTMQINKEDLRKLEQYFKEKNNKISIGPIESDHFQNFLNKK